jgi:energy-coupling factor transporter ATP-binding protein EcfA2
MGADDPDIAAGAMSKYGNLTDRFTSRGGYAAEAEAASIANNLGLPDHVLGQPLDTLSGGQRRRLELARILFSDAETMILDEPTNHLDADSVVWLRNFLANYIGGVIVISHDVALVTETVNRVFYLDANRERLDVYNMGWKHYLRQREADEERRKKERANVEKKATTLQLQAAKFGAKASKAAAAHQMVARAEKMLSGLEDVRAQDRVAKLRFPDPAPCGRTPIMAHNLSKSYGSLEIFTADVTFNDFKIGDTLRPGPGIVIKTAPLNHPNRATGYRVEVAGKSMCYVTDTEHTPGVPDQKILALIEGADLVIYDSTYTDAEFPSKRGWGHSTWQEGVRLVKMAGARRLAIFHHDPDHEDHFMEDVEASALSAWPGCFVARDNMRINLI